MVTAPHANADGLLALLEEDGELDIQTYALQKLNENLDSFWAQISDHIPKIETLHESSALPPNIRELAALVVSRLYYHLGAFDESLSFALRAGKLFDLSERSEYVNSVVEKCIDSYVELRCKSDNIEPDVLPEGDKRMRDVVERMLDRCLADREYKQIIGIALEARRLDVIERVLRESSDPSLISYVMDAALNVVPRYDLRKKILRTLIPFFKTDYFSLTQCLVHLNDSSLATNLLRELLSSNDEEKVLIAYQIGFDLVETASQEFLNNVRRGLGITDDDPSTSNSNESADQQPQQQQEEDGGMELDDEKKESSGGSNSDQEKQDPKYDTIRSILSGVETVKLYLSFLQRNNHTDPLILSQTKDALDTRASIYNSAMTFCHAYAHVGTTSEDFLRNNLDWLAKASSWSKFSATAALGVIHKGNLNNAFSILNPYLPKEDMTAQGSFYSESGSLYALGLIHANHGREVIPFLRRFLTHNSEIVQHGAALGLGVAGMATGDEAIYEDLRSVLFNDSAVAGEAAGYAMGLVMLGTASQKALEEMLQYAHETQHEKIIRGLSVGMSLLFVGLQEEADSLIQTLSSDPDPLLRYGGIYTIAMAYAGTGKNKAIKQLLHVAVSDVNDDVRRAAVTGLGFILYKDPEQVPRVVQLLSESYNPNVRYGATLALGISCAGTGLSGAIDLLEPMTRDSTDFVRQGASIALAMIMIEQNETQNPRVALVRKGFAKTIQDKHEDAMAKFGAAVAQGIIDAGGRNMTISLQSKLGSPNIPAIAGMAMFTQFWYWFPLAHFLSLALQPTPIIGVTKDLKVPKLSLISNAKPSLYSYIPPTKPKQKESVEKSAPAVLSTTAKANARQRTKEKEKEKAEAEAMETDEKVENSEQTTNKDEDNTNADNNKTGEENEEGSTGQEKSSKRQRQEPGFDVLENLSRVVPAQLPHITSSPDSKYFPLRPLASVNRRIVILKDARPDLEPEFVDVQVKKQDAAVNINDPSANDPENFEPQVAHPDWGPIADMPEPFEYEFDDEEE